MKEGCLINSLVLLNRSNQTQSDIFYFRIALCFSSRKHAYIILTPLKPHFYVLKLGFTGVYIIFLISVENIDRGYLLEPPRRGGSNEYQQSIF